jgi:coenzyme F420 hydrogenase subunit beta
MWKNLYIRWKMMRTKKIQRVDQIAEWRLCAGCGACAAACANHAIKLVDIFDRGIRPIIDSEKCRKCGGCVEVCPGIGISHKSFDNRLVPGLLYEWGPVLEVWEGYAADSQIRYNGSSGGVATALALFCLEKQDACGVLHIGTREGAPLENVAVFSKSKADLLGRTGSRYSPAAPCEKLEWIQESKSSSVFIGKPCDVVALRKSQAVNSLLDDKVSLAISIFCAGTPATEGTYKILSSLGVEPEQTEEIRYRGCGWPGATTVKMKGDNGQARQMSYEESWGNILSHYGQYRCRICPDSTGEFADISCGDPWYRELKENEQGWSLIVVRTEKGRKILQEAIKAGYVKLERVEPNTIPRSQKALLSRRRHLWGRLLMMWMMRVPVPRYIGFFLLRSWLRLSLKEKLRCLAGTLKRIILRGWMRPLKPGVKTDTLHKIEYTKKPIVNIEEYESQCKV